MIPAHIHERHGFQVRWDIALLVSKGPVVIKVIALATPAAHASTLCPGTRVIVGSELNEIATIRAG